MTILRMRGPRWRGVSLTAAAERLGCAPAVTHHAARHQRLTVRYRRGVGYVALAELERFATSPACWVAVAPCDIVDPALRRVAVAAWRQAGCPQWHRTGDLARRYAVSRATIARWRERGWQAGAWHWHGNAAQTKGEWWLIWAGDLPAGMPVPYILPRVQPTRRAVGAARRQAVLRAVAARGGPPGRGASGDFWRAVAAEAGCAVVTAQTHYARAQRQERNHAAD